VRAPESLGLGSRTHANYTDDNDLDGVGGFSNGKENGKWIYYHSNSEKSAEGVYNNGVKKGAWNYYTDEGILNSTEDEDTGEITRWYPEGGKEYNYFVTNGGLKVI